MTRGEPEPGETLGRFRLTGVVGRGGMGVVYRALDAELGREVALKLLVAADPSSPAAVRFRREAQILASLEHPNVGVLHEIGEERGFLYQVMALYRGESLGERLARQGALPAHEAAGIAAALAAGLAGAHRAGVVHRDLSPGNVFLTERGGVRLLDFGLARHRDMPALTEAGEVLGTVAYMAPEQLRGEPATPRTDLWAVGVLLYEMLSGRPPFAADSPGGTVRAILDAAPEPLPEATPEVLRRLVERCLDKDAEERPSGADEVLETLRASGWDRRRSAATTLPRPLAPAPAAHPRRRRWVGVLALGLAVALGGILARWLPTHSPRTAPGPDPAEATGRLVVAVPRCEVTFTGDPGENPEHETEAALLAASLRIAVYRALTSVGDVEPVDPSEIDAVAGPPDRLARAVAADEVLGVTAACPPGGLCQVFLRRLRGTGARVAWAETLQVPLDRPRLAAEAVAGAVARAYPGRAVRRDRLTLAVDDATYRRYLELRRRVDGGGEALAPLLSELETLARGSPSFTEAAYLASGLARYLFQTTGEAGYLERGLTTAAAAAVAEPEDPRPLAARVDLLLAARRLDDARREMARLTAIDPAAEGTLLREAKLLEASGEAAGALDLAKQVVERHPSWRNFLILANLQSRQGRIDDARRSLESLLLRDPGNLQGAEALGRMELLGGDLERAVELLEGVAGRAAGSAAPTNLGVAQILLGRYDEAVASLQQAELRAPGNPQITLNLADALELAGQRDRAREAYRRVVEQTAGTGGETPWPMVSAEAQAFAHLGSRDQAVAAIQRALRQAPDEPQLAYEASLVYVLLEEPTSALFHARRALEGKIASRWFRLPWFAPLEADEGFRAAIAGDPSGRGLDGIRGDDDARIEGV